MVDVVGVAVVLVGAVVLLAGAALSVYAVALLGAGIGGAAGYLIAPMVGLDGLLGAAIAVAVGLIAGVLVTYLVLSAAIASLGFLVGGYLGVVLAGAVFGPDAGLLRLAGFPIGGLIGAGLAPVLTRSLLVFVTAFIGATLVSGALTAGDLATAQADLTLEPLLVDPGSPMLLALFVVGVLVQFGLFRFGHVRRLAVVLPGASVVRDRMGSSDGEEERA